MSSITTLPAPITELSPIYTPGSIQAMKERRSVRSFNGQPLSSAIVSDLRKVIDESYTLFGGNVTIRLESYQIYNR